MTLPGKVGGLIPLSLALKPFALPLGHRGGKEEVGNKQVWGDAWRKGEHFSRLSKKPVTNAGVRVRVSVVVLARWTCGQESASRAVEPGSKPVLPVDLFPGRVTPVT